MPDKDARQRTGITCIFIKLQDQQIMTPKAKPLHMSAACTAKKILHVKKFRKNFAKEKIWMYMRDRS